MYGALWNRLPGPWPVKTLESLALVTGVVLLLFVVVFPWAEPRLPFSDVTVEDGQPGADTVEPGTTEPGTTGPVTPGTAPVEPQLPGDSSAAGVVGSPSLATLASF